MRYPLRLVGLLSFIVVLAACSGRAGLLLGPRIKVTPAIAPIAVGSATGLAPKAGAQTKAVGQTPSGAATESVPLTPRPVRTPIRVRVPAAPPVILTPTPSAPGQAGAAPTQEVVEAPAATPVVILPTPAAEPSAGVATQEPAQPETGGAPTPTLPPGAGRLDTTMNILVVGSDERTAGQPWRSDVIMLVAVDFARRELGLISFPRDMWVTIPTVGENRINTATFFGDVNSYPTGGIGLLRDTLAQDFGLRVDHYVKVDFESFKDVVDALGGVDMTIDCAVTGNFPKEPGSRELVWQTLQPGKYHMDGFFALRYARERKASGGDIDRARRQQRLLIGMRNRAREVNIIPRIPALYDALKQSIETDLGLTDLIALARIGVQVDPRKAHGFIIDYNQLNSWTTPQGAMVLLPDYDKINEGINTLFDQPSVLESPNKPANCKAATPTPP